MARSSSTLVAVASSTGGPRALMSMISKLPADMACPMVIVQHMPEKFTELFANRLDQISKVKVHEAKDGEVLEDGCVYIAPGGYHMKIVKHYNRHAVKLTKEPPIGSLRPCANVMYDSLVSCDFEKIVCVVLTGMGSDGTDGISHLARSKANISILAQDEKSCVVYSMPKSIIETEFDVEVYPIGEMAQRIITKVGS